jgi:hypothetical protein
MRVAFEPAGVDLSDDTWAIALLLTTSLDAAEMLRSTPLTLG